jgi:multiple sugar transport system ATP-binding protein
MASVTYEHVYKKFGDVVAVDDLDIQVADKEFLVLVGPSGCGKTTALRLLAGLEEITSGRILIGDRVVNDVAPKDRDIAMVFQSYALYPHLSVYDNMAFGLNQRSSSLTSRFPTWMPNCGWPCAPKFRNCISASRPPSSMLPTTRQRP